MAEVSFLVWLEWLFFNRQIFTKIIIGLALLVCMPAYMAHAMPGTPQGTMLTALALCLAIVFFAVLRYRYWLDVANPPAYWNKMKEARHADPE